MSGRRSRPAYSIQGRSPAPPGYHGNPTCLKSRNTAALGSLLDALFSLLISLFFCVNLLNDGSGQVWKQIGPSPISRYSSFKTTSCLFSFVTGLWGMDSWTHCSLRRVVTQPLQGGIHPFPEDPGGRAHEILCHSMWSLQGFANGPALSWNVEHGTSCLCLAGGMPSEGWGKQGQEEENILS